MSTLPSDAKNCREAGPGKGRCIECANGNYERCLYVVRSSNEVVDKSWQELARAAQLEREEFRCKVIEQSAEIERLKAVIVQVKQARLDWAMVCECSCNACETLSNVIRLIGRGAVEPPAHETGEQYVHVGNVFGKDADGDVLVDWDSEEYEPKPGTILFVRLWTRAELDEAERMGDELGRKLVPAQKASEQQKVAYNSNGDAYLVDPRHCSQCGPHPNESSEEHTRKAHTFEGLFGEDASS